MTEHAARLSASILDSDLGNLKREVRRAIEAGADRIHLDVMDGHFVPNITFGAGTIKRLRKLTDVPFDAHLMISEPSRYVKQFIEAGCDTVTFHVEVDEPVAPTLRAIREAGRAPGLAIKPATPITALEPYRDLLDIVMVMTVEPGFGGQSFMKDAARKILPARGVFRGRESGGEVHVDGGVNQETAEFCGGLGVDVLVVGSVLWKKDRDIAEEIATIKGLADRGYADRRARGKLPDARDRWTPFARLPKAIGKQLAAAIELDGIPVIQLRSDGRPSAEGPQEYDVLVPAGAEAAAIERFGDARAKAESEAAAWRAERLAERAASDGADSFDGQVEGERQGAASGQEAR